MRIYLDNCCYNRPYDDQTNLRIQIESQAKLAVQSRIRQGLYEAVNAKCDYFLTTDRKVLNTPVPELKIVNPVQFIFEVDL